MSLFMNNRVAIFLAALGVVSSLVAIWPAWTCVTWEPIGTNCLAISDFITPLWLLGFLPDSLPMGPFDILSWAWYIVGIAITVLALVANNSRMRHIGTTVLFAFFAAHLIDEAQYFLDLDSTTRRFFPITSAPFWIALAALALSIIPAVVQLRVERTRPQSPLKA